MGAIKDIVDLTKDLESRAKERRDMDIIHKIQSLAFAFQSSYTDIVERDVRLVQENAELKKKLSETEAEEIRVVHDVEFRKGSRTSGQWRPFCPKCHLPVSYPDDGGDQMLCPDQKCGWISNKMSQQIHHDSPK